MEWPILTGYIFFDNYAVRCLLLHHRGILMCVEPESSNPTGPVQRSDQDSFGGMTFMAYTLSAMASVQERAERWRAA